jgi:hypothetical protein
MIVERGDESEPMTVKRFVVVRLHSGPFQVVDTMTGREMLFRGVPPEQAEFYANLFNGRLRECEEGRHG